jgi:hypothetical protein
MLKKINNLLRQLIINLFGGNPPKDPYAGSLYDKRGPRDRIAAAAIAEPGDE